MNLARKCGWRSGWLLLGTILVPLTGCGESSRAGGEDAGRDAAAPDSGSPDGAVDAGQDASGEGGGPAGSYCSLAPLVPSIGYGAHRSVTGGLAYCAAPTVVLHLDDSGPGSLREAIASDRYVVFSPDLRDGTIALAGDLVTTDVSNVTLDGRGSDGSSLNITLTTNALKFDGPENVVVAYLRFLDNVATAETDGLTMRGRAGRTPSFYIVHNTFINAADGALDIIWRRGSDVWATLEANHFRCNDKTLLINSSGEQSAPEEGAGRYHITMYRNWFEENVQRQPLARSTDLHYLNNVVTEEGIGGKATDAGRDAHFLIEDNAFQSGTGGTHCAIASRTGRRFILIGGPGARVTERGNLLLDGGSGPPYNDDPQGTGFVTDGLAPPYSYSRTPMDAALMQAVMSTAGNQ